jgi:flagellar motility protein MotE (MotC chaperone)
MKKIIIITQFIVLLLFLVKIVALGEVMSKANAAGLPQATVKHLQSDSSPKIVAPEAKSAAEADGLARPRDILTSLEVKKNDLDKKEQFLRAEEQRLLLLKKEIVEKIDLLRSQEEKLNASVEVQKTAESKNFKELAKVLEATPPAKAGLMLEQLDVKTAAGITMNMKRDKAGAIWGYLSPQKAVEITREITHLGKP